VSALRPGFLCFADAATAKVTSSLLT